METAEERSVPRAVNERPEGTSIPSDLIAAERDTCSSFARHVRPSVRPVPSARFIIGWHARRAAAGPDGKEEKEEQCTLLNLVYPNANTHKSSFLPKISLHSTMIDSSFSLDRRTGPLLSGKSPRANNLGKRKGKRALKEFRTQKKGLRKPLKEGQH